jgi:hypothetical protein
LAIEGFVQAVKNVSANHKNVLLHFIGTMDIYTKQLLENELPNNHKITSYIPHKELMNYLLQSQVLLLSIPKGNNQGTIPGKLFEYLATQKTIICLGPQGCSAGEIIAECQAGKTFTHNVVDQIEKYLLELNSQFESGKDITVQSTIYKKYARKELTKRYADVIESVK